MDINIICACTDLGVHVDGTDLGPLELAKNLDIKKYIINKENIIKSKDKNDLRKNESSINKFTKETYDCVSNILKSNSFPLLIGGDHSSVIGSALASCDYYKNIGIIWIDAHGDYNTFETTRTGNIHGLPLAAITGYKCNDLTCFITSNYINPKNCVIVGARNIDPLENKNLIDAGVTIFTTDDVKREGASNIIKRAISIASTSTFGIHVSFDIDVIDPVIAPGVSTPEANGINEDEAYEIMNEIIKNKDILKSFDLVEFNPLKDIDDKTKLISLHVLNMLINAKM